MGLEDLGLELLAFLVIVVLASTASLLALRLDRDPGRLTWLGLVVWLLWWLPLDLRWARPGADFDNAYLDGLNVKLPRKCRTAEDVAEVVVLAATNRNLTGTVIEADAGARLVSLV